MFASKTPRDLNHDPMPWRNPTDGERRSHGVKWISGPDVYDPRPEFDHVQHNEPNVILVAFRSEFDATPPAERERLIFAWLSWFREPFHEWSPDHITHARKVLSRLVALEAERDYRGDYPPRNINSH